MILTKKILINNKISKTIKINQKHNKKINKLEEKKNNHNPSFSRFLSIFEILTLFVRVVYLRNTFNNIRCISVPMNFHPEKEEIKIPD